MKRSALERMAVLGRTRRRKYKNSIQCNRYEMRYSVDERLNEDAYIVPGLGDAGDRIFGTR